MLRLRARTLTVAAVVCAVAGGSVAGAHLAASASSSDASVIDPVVATLPVRVPLAPIVASWPDSYTVVGSKSEPLYTERIASAREGDLFVLRIEAIAQGDSRLGTQRSAVRVAADGSVAWVAGCLKAAASCASDPALRGFLTTAALVGLERAGRLPDVGTARALHGTPVVCVEDVEVHPDASPSTAGLDPCFSAATGALLGHWSARSAAFVGPTLAPGFVETVAVDSALVTDVLP